MILTIIFRSWKTFVQVLTEAYPEAFFSVRFSIVRKELDSLTRHAVFFLKAKHIPTSIALKTKEIIQNDKYLLRLSSEDRKAIERQYLLEIHQPMAYIEEYPIHTEPEGKNIFKIFILEEKKIVCGTAAYFMEEDLKTVLLLSKPELLKITISYYMERLDPQTRKRLLQSDNVIKLVRPDRC